MNRGDDLDRMHDALRDLRQRVGGYRYLVSSGIADGWPQRDVYFFLDNEDPREGGDDLRVVRVGTHALKRESRTTLWNRLHQHRGTIGGRWPGGGNHRGSVFRLHVGNALIAKDDYSEPIRRSWGIGSTADIQTRIIERPLELAVSGYIRRLPFLWLGVADSPGPDSDRGVIERNAIGLLSSTGRFAPDQLSRTWLGKFSSSPAIRESGLWNVNHIGNGYDPSFLDLLARYIRAM